jgi:predicted NACHT family NTPase
VLAFLHQLLARLPLGYNSIEENYEKWAFRGLDHESIQFEEAWTLFCAATEQYQRVYVIVDGLDEVEPNKRGQLLDAINGLLSEDNKQSKVLISSRDLPETSRFHRFQCLGIRPSDNEDDIRKIVNMRTEKNGQTFSLGQYISPDTKQYLRHFLAQRSQGMYVVGIDKGQIKLLSNLNTGSYG